jgi:hypothetical protein
MFGDAPTEFADAEDLAREVGSVSAPPPGGGWTRVKYVLNLFGIVIDVTHGRIVAWWWITYTAEGDMTDPQHPKFSQHTSYGMGAGNLGGASVR